MPRGGVAMRKRMRSAVSSPGLTRYLAHSRCSMPGRCFDFVVSSLHEIGQGLSVFAPLASTPGDGSAPWRPPMAGHSGPLALRSRCCWGSENPSSPWPSGKRLRHLPALRRRPLPSLLCPPLLPGQVSLVSPAVPSAPLGPCRNPGWLPPCGHRPALAGPGCVQRQDFALLGPSQPGGQPSTKLTVARRNSTCCSETPVEFSIEIREGEGFRQSK